MPPKQPGFAVARPPRRGARPPATPEKYDAVTDLMAKQAEWEAATVRWEKAVRDRNHAAARAHKVGRLSWTQIGQLLGKVGDSRAQDIAHPRRKKKKETTP